MVREKLPFVRRVSQEEDSLSSFNQYELTEGSTKDEDVPSEDASDNGDETQEDDREGYVLVVL